ncbi:MAG: hypothetical protein ACOYD6_04285 [Limnochordia bacterium]
MEKRIEGIETLDDLAAFMAISALDAARDFLDELSEECRISLRSWVEIIVFSLFALDVVSGTFIEEKLPGERDAFWTRVLEDIRDFSELEEGALSYFDNVLDHRFLEYFQALQAQHELGPVWTVGHVAAQNIIGEKDEDLFFITGSGIRFMTNVKLFESYFTEPELFIW